MHVQRASHPHSKALLIPQEPVGVYAKAEHERDGIDAPFLTTSVIWYPLFRHHDEPGKNTFRTYVSRGKRNLRKASSHCHSASWDV